MNVLHPGTLAKIKAPSPLSHLCQGILSQKWEKQLMQYLNEVKRFIVNDRGSPSVSAAVTTWIVCVIPIPKLSAYNQCALSQLKNMVLEV